MTMAANLVTEKAHIDLEGLCFSPLEGKAMLRQSGNEGFYSGECLKIRKFGFPEGSRLTHRMPLDYDSNGMLSTLPYPALVML